MILNQKGAVKQRSVKKKLLPMKHLLFCHIHSFVQQEYLCPMSFESMRAFRWQISGAAYSTALTQLTEEITEKFNSSQSCIFSKLRVIYYIPDDWDGVENAFPMAARGTVTTTKSTAVARSPMPNAGPDPTHCIQQLSLCTAINYNVAVCVFAITCTAKSPSKWI